MNVQVRLVRVAGIPDSAQRLACSNPVPPRHEHTAPLEVAEQDPDAAAREDHVVAGHVRAVGDRGAWSGLRSTAVTTEVDLAPKCGLGHGGTTGVGLG